MASPTVSSRAAAPGRSRTCSNTLAVSRDFMLKRCRTSSRAPHTKAKTRPAANPMLAAMMALIPKLVLPRPASASKYSRTTSPVSRGVMWNRVQATTLAAYSTGLKRISRQMQRTVLIPDAPPTPPAAGTKKASPGQPGAGRARRARRSSHAGESGSHRPA